MNWLAAFTILLVSFGLMLLSRIKLVRLQEFTYKLREKKEEWAEKKVQLS
jgi:hypothetical protein